MSSQWQCKRCCGYFFIHKVSHKATRRCEPLLLDRVVWTLWKYVGKITNLKKTTTVLSTGCSVLSTGTTQRDSDYRKNPRSYIRIVVELELSKFLF